MVNTILIMAGVLMALGILLALLRFIKGPDVTDRTIAFDVMTVASISVIALIAHFAGRIIYLDVALVYGLLSFLSVVVIGRYIERGL
ncbi:MAG: monovalent cation/H+ antiporter complex subunit F [Tenuifilum sp.]|uniref:monovalent cation/H+ antiporter complex subunit F n=1 Tax=Tenuifilum TaxID=2760873 RepID=UPI002BE19A3C|nr:monovalent cation/H+ antiporter complex subunit F [Tenuifilum sp.]HQG71487.1 monovalent cation/H+ antiporter complex subunit F [Tenuifilum sp.]HQI88331.1 monovalent cation/H+ antiporter complex subunit F [Tenuifilum sp.]